MSQSAPAPPVSDSTLAAMSSPSAGAPLFGPAAMTAATGVVRAAEGAMAAAGGGGRRGGGGGAAGGGVVGGPPAGGGGGGPPIRVSLPSPPQSTSLPPL